MSVTDEARGSRTRGRAALAAFAAGFVLLAIVAGAQGSTLQPRLFPGAGPPEPLRAIGGWLGLDTASPAVRELAALAVSLAAIGGFLVLLREAWRGNVSLRTILWSVVIAHVAVLLMLPLLYSRDVYGYAIYGRMVSIYGVNPYVAVPRLFPSDAVYPLVAQDWIGTRSPYGPAFTLLSAAVTGVVRSPAGVVATFRLVAATASLGTTVLVAWTVGRLRRSRVAFAVALVGLNPVVLFQTVGGGHNDALIALSIAAALALVVRGHVLAAAAALTLGTLVKVPVVVPLILLVAADVSRRDAGARLRALLSHLLVVVSVSLPFVITLFRTSDPTFGLAQLVSHEGWLSPAAWVRRVLTNAASAASDPFANAVSIGVRAASALLMGVVLIALARSLMRRPAESVVTEAVPLGAAWAWGLLALALLVPVFLPWYLLWLLPVAWLLPLQPRRLVIVLCAMQSVSLVVVEQALPNGDRNVEAVLWVLAPAALILSLGAARDLVRRLRDDTPLELDGAFASAEVDGLGSPS
jgi:hypothetical protein